MLPSWWRAWSPGDLQRVSELHGEAGCLLSHRPCWGETTLPKKNVNERHLSSRSLGTSRSDRDAGEDRSRPGRWASSLGATVA